MAEITLQDMINKVKEELFSPSEGTQRAGKIIYPIFFIDSVELELSINIKSGVNGEIKVIIPQLLESSLGSNKEVDSGHKVTIKLSPIMGREEMREIINHDERLMKGIRDATEVALRKGVSLEGE